MSSRETYEATWGQVWTAVRAYVRDLDDGDGRLTAAYSAVAARLGFAQTDTTAWDYQDAERFHGQVRRALEKLARAGELAKVGQSATGPDGYQFLTTSYGRGSDLRYFTPAAYEKAKADDEAPRAQRDFERRRNERLWDDLEALGYPPLGDRRFAYGKPPQLSPDRMADLITLAKAERARRTSSAEAARPGGGGGGRG